MTPVASTVSCVRLDRRPGAGIARHRPAVEAVVDDLLQTAGLSTGIITSVNANSDWCAVVDDSAVWSSPAKREHAAVARGAGEIGVAQHVAGTIDAGSLAVPEPKTPS